MSSKNRIFKSSQFLGDRLQNQKWFRIEGPRTVSSKNRIFKSSQFLGNSHRTESISKICGRLTINTGLLTLIGILLSIYCVAAFHPIVHKPLDENVIYGIRVARRMGTTTVLFPGAISGIFGQKVAKQPQENADFLINFTPGSFHFTLRALHENAEDQLTVIFDRKAYVLHLTAADEAHLTISFFSPKRVASGKSIITPEKLLSILDRAKAYSFLKSGALDALVGVDRVALGRQMYYEGFRVILQEVFRFDPEDVLVFHIELQNESDHWIRYRPDELAARLGNRIYPQVIADGSGGIPPRGKEGAFFAVVGMPGGGRNDLQAENPWNILVVRAGGKMPIR